MYYRLSTCQLHYSFTRMNLNGVQYRGYASTKTLSHSSSSVLMCNIGTNERKKKYNNNNNNFGQGSLKRKRMEKKQRIRIRTKQYVFLSTEPIFWSFFVPFNPTYVDCCIHGYLIQWDTPVDLVPNWELWRECNFIRNGESVRIKFFVLVIFIVFFFFLFQCIQFMNRIQLSYRLTNRKKYTIMGFWSERCFFFFCLSDS